MYNWPVVWDSGDTVDLLFLIACFSVVASVPLIYASRANLRDSLARAVLASTLAPVFLLGIRIFLLLAYHMGHTPDRMLWHWVIRLTSMVFGIGELMLLLALLRVLREHKTDRESQ